MHNKFKEILINNNGLALVYNGFNVRKYRYKDFYTFQE